MAWMTIEEYIKKEFSPDSRPKIRTVRRWIKTGQVMARKLGKMYYIDPQKEALESPQANMPFVGIKKIKTGNPLVDRVLGDS